ncbi:hypothetical protein ACMGGR_15610 [Erwinia sp. BNK-24-b]|uniref:hypothetical protein n=1 Tax=unclassified Erwinia TaxID=2622719 RepID=UPI0039BEF36D
MDSELFLLLFQPGEFYAPRSAVTYPNVILKCDDNASLKGNNALFHQENDLLASQVITDEKSLDIDPTAYQFHYFTDYHRQLKKSSEEQFDALFKEINLGLKFNQLMPAVAIRVDKEKRVAKLYHFNDTAWHGTIFVKYAEVPISEAADENGWALCTAALAAAYPRLLQYRHLLNDTCWYTRWKHDMELERKYTFKEIPNTWQLNTRLYEAINLRGELPGFVPELDMSFQVFDYDNHIFEVMEKSAKGYISFIPQANHKVAIKQKWFEENAELRKESIVYDIALHPEEYEEKAREMAGGEVKRLAPFRRKRFDVNFESLETGNIYGVYFDICRSLDDPGRFAFSQCEVEYCRSRTFFDYSNVLKEYEQVCAFVKAFLDRQGVAFEQNLYSKLDFARETYSALAQQQEVTHG